MCRCACDVMCQHAQLTRGDCDELRALLCGFAQMCQHDATSHACDVPGTRDFSSTPASPSRSISSTPRYTHDATSPLSTFSSNQTTPTMGSKKASE